MADTRTRAEISAQNMKLRQVFRDENISEELFVAPFRSPFKPQVSETMPHPAGVVAARAACLYVNQLGITPESAMLVIEHVPQEGSLYAYFGFTLSAAEFKMITDGMSDTPHPRVAKVTEQFGGPKSLKALVVGPYKYQIHELDQPDPVQVLETFKIGAVTGLANGGMGNTEVYCL